MSTATDSKYDFIDHETFTISRSIWVPLNKKELMELPWIREVIANPGARLLINYCRIFTLVRISEGGGIICVEREAPLYILKNSTRPARLRLDEMYHDEEGFVKAEPLNSSEIYWASISHNRTQNKAIWMTFRRDSIGWTSVSRDHIQNKTVWMTFRRDPISWTYDRKGQLTDEDNLSINRDFPDYDEYY